MGLRNEHIDGPLSNFATAYEPPGYFADVLSPPVLVDSLSDEFHKRRRIDMVTPHDDRMSADGRANRSTYRYLSDTYVCVHRALVDYVSAVDLDNADEALDIMEDTTGTILNRMALNREIRVAALYADSNNYASGHRFTAGAPWTDQVNGDPLENVQRARRLLPPSGGTGSQIVMICDEAVFDALASHPALRGGGNLTPVLSEAEVASRLRIDRILVSEAEKNTANEGQTATLAPVWDATKCWLARVPTGTPNRRTQAFSVTFRFRNGTIVGQRGPGVNGVAVRRWDEPGIGPSGSIAIQPNYSDAEKTVQNDLAVEISGVTA